MAEWLSLRAPLQAAQYFVGSNPGRGHGAARQATLRRHPTSHNRKDLQLRYTTMYQGGLGNKAEKKKRLATVVSPCANLKKKKESII